MPLDVRPVRTRRDREAFLALPHTLYRDEPGWTPPLREDFWRSLSEANPLWAPGRGERALLLAWEGERAVGRVVVHVQHASNARHAERAAFFGYLDTGPDGLAAARALLERADDFARARGLTVLRGPYELTAAQCLGAVVSGFEDAAAFSQGWSPPHLPGQLQALGFSAHSHALTLRQDDLASVDVEALLGAKQRAWLERPDVRLRSWDLRRFDEDLAAAMGLLHASFADNFGFVPMSPAEVQFMAAPMRRVVRPELTVFLELEGRPVGVGMVLPDFHALFRRMGGSLWPLGWARFLLGAKALDGAVVQFLATDPALQNQGLMRVVVAELVRRLQRAGFRTLDGTWIGETNVRSLAQARAIGMREKHRLTLFHRAVGGAAGCEPPVVGDASGALGAQESPRAAAGVSPPARAAR